MKSLLGLIAAGFVAFTPLSPANSEVIRASAMAQGITITQTQCAALATAVWVMVNRQGYCIRYYLSTSVWPKQDPGRLSGGRSAGDLRSKHSLLSQGR